MTGHERPPRPQQQRPAGLRACRVSIVAAVAGLVLAAWLRLGAEEQQQPLPASDVGFAVREAIPRVPWPVGMSAQDARAFVAQVVADRRPVIFTGSPVAAWPALTRWRDRAYLEARVPRVLELFWQLRRAWRFLLAR